MTLWKKSIIMKLMKHLITSPHVICYGKETFCVKLTSSACYARYRHCRKRLNPSTANCAPLLSHMHSQFFPLLSLIIFYMFLSFYAGNALILRQPTELFCLCIAFYYKYGHTLSLQLLLHW